MFHFQAVGFAIILAVVGLGVDYHQQTLKSDLKVGELTAGAYFGTITSRFSDVQAAKQAKIDEKERKSRVRDGARPYLPEAPEGWTRRELVAGDNSRIMPPKREISDAEREVLEANALLRNMAAKSEANVLETKNAETWVYERGDDIVSVRAQFIEMPTDNTISSTALTMIAGNMEAMAIRQGWGVINGVAYGFYTSFDGKKPKTYRSLDAVIGFGSEVRLSVRTTADDMATREILDQIDYDGLNALLPRPLAHVGSNAPEVPLDAQADVARQIMEIRADLIRQRTAAAEDWLMSASNPEDAMTLALRQAGFGVTGSMGAEDAALADTLKALEDKSMASPLEDGTEDKADSGRLYNMVAGLFRSKNRDAAALPADLLPEGNGSLAFDAPEAAPAQPKEGVKRFGAGSSFANCTMDGAVKRCSLEN